MQGAVYLTYINHPDKDSPVCPLFPKGKVSYFCHCSPYKGSVQDSCFLSHWRCDCQSTGSSHTLILKYFLHRTWNTLICSIIVYKILSGLEMQFSGVAVFFFLFALRGPNTQLPNNHMETYSFLWMPSLGLFLNSFLKIISSTICLWFFYLSFSVYLSFYSCSMSGCRAATPPTSSSPYCSFFLVYSLCLA